MKLNKFDIGYIVFICIISLSLFMSSIFIFKLSKGSIAIISYDGKEIMQVSLDVDQEIILLKAEYPKLLADMVIGIENGKIRVIEEKSPLHYCSNMGAISSSQQSIVCLPNRVVITIVGNAQNGAVDLEVR